MEKTRNKLISPRRTCVSLFSGCGGLDLGLHKAGFEIVFANDIDAKCVLSYEENFGKDTIYKGSITDVTKDLLFSSLEPKFPAGLHVDLLAGGPPCPPYSKSRFYRKEKPRALEDPVGFETLNGYLEVLANLHPKAFLFENVSGFSFSVHKEAFNRLIDFTTSLGYTCNYRVLNAADYGVPQIRQRFILVGIIGKKFEFPKPTHRDPDKNDLFTLNLPPWITAGEAIGDLDNAGSANDDGHFAGGKYHDLLEQIPPGDNYLFFTKERGHPNPVFRWRSRYWSYLLKLSPNMPSWTIQARRSNNMGPFHWRNRILRIAEIKRLQSFPDDFDLVGTLEQQWHQIGNAVPPKLAQVLGEAIKAQLEEIDEYQPGA